jgi:hypothetical protein
MTRQYLTFILIYSRIEVAAETRREGRSCGCPPQGLHNKADAVRSIRLKGKFGRIFFGRQTEKMKKGEICKTLMILLILKKFNAGFGQIYE